jgi:hypothetical protein
VYTQRQILDHMYAVLQCGVCSRHAGADACAYHHAHLQAAQQAISHYNGFELEGRALCVTYDRKLQDTPAPNRAAAA